VDPGEGRSAVQKCYRVEIEQEEDGRWIAEVVNLPGVMAYGETAEAALAHAQALALRVLAGRLENGGGPPGPLSVTFETSAAA
jgi:predicted RNase H-like HicB family nuclease